MNENQVRKGRFNEIPVEKRKLFVGGLNPKTTTEGLQHYFGQFCPVEEALIIRNRITGQPRGFGFVTFTDPVGVAAVLKGGPHFVDRTAIDPQLFTARKLGQQKRTSISPSVFLGGLPLNVIETDLRKLFDRYGKVVQVDIKHDHVLNRARGFGFVSFENQEPVERLINEHFINFNGKMIEIKRAEFQGIRSRMRPNSRFDVRGGNVGQNRIGIMDPPGAMIQNSEVWRTPLQPNSSTAQGHMPSGGESSQGEGTASSAQRQQLPKVGGRTCEQSRPNRERVKALDKSSSRHN